MEQTKEITLKVNLTARKVYALLVLALMLWRPALLDSAQTMTMTSYYPAPYGGYYQLVSKSTTYLADTAGTSVYLNRNGGVTQIGNENTNTTRTDERSSMNQYGTSYLGRMSQNTTAPTSANLFGATHIGYQSGQVYVGYNTNSQITTATGYSGLFSNVPLATNKHIYIGSDGGSTQKKSGKDVSSSFPYSNDAKLLVNLTGYGNSSDGGPSGIMVVKNNYSAFLDLDNDGTVGTEAVIGAGSGTRLRIVSDGFPAITVDRSRPLYTTIHGRLTVQGDIILDNWSKGSNKTDKTKIKGLCYQQQYLGGTTSCETGYVAIGFLPHNNMSAASKVVTDGKAYNSGSYSGNPMLYTQDVRFSAQGYMTCCALDLNKL